MLSSRSHRILKKKKKKKNHFFGVVRGKHSLPKKIMYLIGIIYVLSILVILILITLLDPLTSPNSSFPDLFK